MGNTKSEIVYAVPVSEKIAGETEIFRHPLSVDSLVLSPHPEIHTMQDAILKAFTRHSDRKCLGTRLLPSQSPQQSQGDASQKSFTSLPAVDSKSNTASSGQTEYGGARTQEEKERRIKQIVNSSQLSFTEKQHMIEVENKKFELEKNGPPTSAISNLFSSQKYQWKTYSNVQTTVHNLATGMEFYQVAEISDEAEYQNYELKLVSIWSRPRPEWVLVDCANILYGNVTIPIAETISAADLSYILEDTSVSTVFCGLPEILRLARMYQEHLAAKEISACFSLGNLRNLICFDEDIPITIQSMLTNELGLNIFTLKLLIDKGATLPQIPLPRISADHVISFSYTIREEDGKPLAAMLTHRNFISFLASIWNISQIKPQNTDVYLSYLPLHHVYEKSALFAALYAGAQIGFSSGDISVLMDDIANLQPTIFCSVPSVYNKLFQSVTQKYFQTNDTLARWMNQKALQSKLEAYQNSANADLKHTLYDNTVFSSARESLGGKLRIAFSSSAPLFPHVHQLLKLVYGIPIVEAYGCTQSTGLSFMSSPLDSTEGHVGGPTLNTEFKIIDSKEFGYTTDDKDEKGARIVRGELCLRGPSIFDGYFRDHQSTQKDIDKNGWYHTGDIVQLRPNGSIKIIDQRKSIFKISQGEYVCPMKLERIYQQCVSISDIYVYGSPYQKYLVAVLVPRKDFVDACAQEFALPSNDYAENCTNQIVQAQILLDLQEMAKLQKLYPFEFIQKIWIELTPFSILGLTTPSNILKRQLAHQQFAQAIHKLYEFA